MVLIQALNARIEALEELHTNETQIEFRYVEGTSPSNAEVSSILESMGDIDAQYVMVELTDLGSACFQSPQAASLLANPGPVDSEFIRAEHHFRVGAGE